MPSACVSPPLPSGGGGGLSRVVRWLGRALAEIELCLTTPDLAAVVASAASGLMVWVGGVRSTGKADGGGATCAPLERTTAAFANRYDSSSTSAPNTAWYSASAISTQFG